MKGRYSVIAAAEPGEAWLYYAAEAYVLYEP